MTFNFDEIIDRRHSDSYKWGKYYNKDIIPLWIADTDFRSPPCIIKALHKRVNHGIFGYSLPDPEELKDIFIKRMMQLYQWKIRPEWLVFLPGLVSGLYLSVRTLTNKNQSVIIPHPIYPPFIEAAKSAGRQQRLATMRLLKNRWCVDFSVTNLKLYGDEGMLMLCNPHNPGGTSYRKDELIEHLYFAKKNNLLVCSDEIHCELLLTLGIKHTPFGSLNEDASQRSIVLMSPSKSFNIAGLGASIAIIANTKLRMKFINQRTGIVPSVDLLALTAATSAWKHGQSWLDQQLDYLRQNRDYLIDRIKIIPGLELSTIEATYLAWIDASGLGVKDPYIFFENAGVGLSSGKNFGNINFVRLNFGCSKILLKLALDRMDQACKKIKLYNS